VLEVSEKVLTAITRRDNPQMVVGVFAQRLVSLKDIQPKEGDVWVALDRVRDPGNLGTVIRTVDAVGARGVILVGETTDPFAVETVRATMGSIFAVPVARATAAGAMTTSLSASRCSWRWVSTRSRSTASPSPTRPRRSGGPASR
jgi:TrmH family RNA methyltransferase